MTAGSQTLLATICTRCPPGKKYVSVAEGSTVKLASVDQSREGLENNKSVFDAISGGADILTVGRFQIPSITDRVVDLAIRRLGYEEVRSQTVKGLGDVKQIVSASGAQARPVKMPFCGVGSRRNTSHMSGLTSR